MAKTDIYDNPDKLYTYLKGYFAAAKFDRALVALVNARKYHSAQKRKSGTPYIVHPLTMVNHALSMGLVDEELCIGLLYHDVIEDCDEDIDNLDLSESVKKAVKLVTVDDKAKKKDRVAYYAKYYANIANNKLATFIKIIDRANNVSTMAGVFSVEKLREYVLETEQYVLPLLRKAKDDYPMNGDQLFILKYHICSVLSAIRYACSLAEKLGEKTVELNLEVPWTES